MPLAFFLAAPQTVLASYYGNIIAIVFFGVAASLLLLRRYPILAGFCLSLTVLKLPQAAPLAFLIVIFEAPHKQRVLAGFFGMYLARNIAAYVLLGGAPIAAYWKGLFSFSHSIGMQPNLVGLSGLYVQRMPHTERLAAELLSVGVAGALTLWWAWRLRGRERVSVLDNAWLWGIWMLTTPYAHFDDELLLVIPVVALLGHNARNVRQPLSIAVLYLGVGSLFLFSATIHGMQMLWVPLLAVTVCFVAALPRTGTVPVTTNQEFENNLELQSA